MDIGHNLRIVRERQKITQQEVADFLGVDRRTYIDWESGEADIKSSYLPKIAELLHVEISDFFREKSSEIVIHQHHMENKEGAINAGVFFLCTDKETIDQVFDIIKKTKIKEK